MRVATLPRHFPQAEQTAPHVAAPQHEAAKVRSVPAEGTASRGKDRRAPIVVVMKSSRGKVAVVVACRRAVVPGEEKCSW